MVQTIIIGSSMKFRSPRLSILVAALDDLPDPDVDILRRHHPCAAARPYPSPVEQRLSGGHAGGRWWRPSGVNRTAAMELKPFPALLFALFAGGTAADLA